MRISSLLTFVAGLAVAGGSAYLARDMLEAQYSNREANAEGSLVEVVVAARDIAFGHAIEAQKLTTISWPRDALPKGVFTQLKEVLPAQGSEPRRARRAISQGELILTNKISDYGEKVTIVQTLGPNHRAIAIKVTAETAVGGFVTPGDSVDVLLTQGRGDSLKTVTILQNIRVIGVDQDANEQTDAPEIARTVTVEVTPEEGQKLALAQRAGVLSLTLRTLEATMDEPLESIGLKDVLRELSPVPEQQPVRTIIVRRGTTASTTELR